MPTLHLLVKGKVQGVFYRATAKEIADRYSIRGWVRNTEEGDVEIMASGREEDLQRFLDWCRKGPKRALVKDLLVTTQNEAWFEDFQVVR